MVSICFAPLQIVKRAFDLFYILLRHLCVYHRRFDAAVAKQLLYVADVCSVFQQMRGETMTKPVYAYFLVYVRFAHRRFEYILHAPYAVFPAVLPLKQIFFRSVFLVVAPQIVQYGLGQIRVPIFFAFGALYQHLHIAAVDVGDLEVYDFRYAKPHPIAQFEHKCVFRIGDDLKQLLDVTHADVFR